MLDASGARARQASPASSAPPSRTGIATVDARSRPHELHPVGCVPAQAPPARQRHASQPLGASLLQRHRAERPDAPFARAEVPRTRLPSSR